MANEWSLSGAAVLAPWRDRASAVPLQRPNVGPTRSELLLWSALDALGTGWVREHATGRYRLDLYLPSRGLAVEIDGSSHYGEIARQHDATRDEWHAALGIETMRISANHVERDLGGVLVEIARRVALREGPAELPDESSFSGSGEVVVLPEPASTHGIELAVRIVEAEIESFAMGVACVNVLPELNRGWRRLKALARGR